MGFATPNLAPPCGLKSGVGMLSSCLCVNSFASSRKNTSTPTQMSQFLYKVVGFWYLYAGMRSIPTNDSRQLVASSASFGEEQAVTEGTTSGIPVSRGTFDLVNPWKPSIDKIILFSQTRRLFNSSARSHQPCDNGFFETQPWMPPTAFLVEFRIYNSMDDECIIVQRQVSPVIIKVSSLAG